MKKTRIASFHPPFLIIELAHGGGVHITCSDLHITCSGLYVTTFSAGCYLYSTLSPLFVM